MVSNRCILTIPLIIILLLLSRVATATGGYTFADALVSTSAAQSKTSSGLNLEARLILLTFNTALSFTKLNNENIITTVYGGIGLPLWIISSKDYLIVYFNIGTGSKGQTYKAGVQMKLSKFSKSVDLPLGVTLSRETYKDYPEFDNTQLGVYYSFD